MWYDPLTDPEPQTAETAEEDTTTSSTEEGEQEDTGSSLVFTVDDDGTLNAGYQN